MVRLCVLLCRRQPSHMHRLVLVFHGTWSRIVTVRSVPVAHMWLQSRLLPWFGTAVASIGSTSRLYCTRGPGVFSRLYGDLPVAGISVSDTGGRVSVVGDVAAPGRLVRPLVQTHGLVRDPDVCRPAVVQPREDVPQLAGQTGSRFLGRATAFRSLAPLCVLWSVVSWASSTRLRFGRWVRWSIGFCLLCSVNELAVPVRRRRCGAGDARARRMSFWPRWDLRSRLVDPEWKMARYSVLQNLLLVLVPQVRVVRVSEEPNGPERAFGLDRPLRRWGPGDRTRFLRSFTSTTSL